MATTPPLNKVERAHQMYRDGRYREALGFYSDAVVVAKTKAQKIALHSNRAACFLKLHDFEMAADECTSVLELDHKHTGALMLRAQTLVTLKEYQSALFDVNRLLELNPSSEVYLNLQARLKTQLPDFKFYNPKFEKPQFQSLFSNLRREKVAGMELQNTVKEALNALYHHPDDVVRMQVAQWLQEFLRTFGFC